MNIAIFSQDDIDIDMIKRNYHLPSTRCFLAFEACARLENFTAAAQQLNTSQSSISRHISELEAILGASLFERSKQRVQLSEKGRHLYRRVSSGLDSIRDGMQQAANWDITLPITIGCAHAISHLLIMPMFDPLQTAMDDFGQVRIMTAEYELLDAHLDPQIDIRLDVDISNVPSKDFVLLFTEAVKPVCSPDFKRRHGAALTKPPGVWPDLPLLDMSLPNRGWAGWEDWFQSHGARSNPQTPTRFDNYIYLLEACASGRGLALGARGMVDSYLSNGRLVEAYGDYIEYDRGFYAILTERGRVKAASRRCLEVLPGLFCH